MVEDNVMRYGNYEIKVKYGRKKDSCFKPRLVVSFSGVGKEGTIPGSREIIWEFEGTFSDDDETHVVFVRDCSCGWYTDSEEFFQVIEFLEYYMRTNGIKNASSLGLSMGGFGALLLSAYMDLDNVVVFSPQTLVGKGPENSLDRRYDKIIERASHAVSGDLGPLSFRANNVYVFAGEDDWLDVWHTIRISGKTNVNAYLVPKADHNTARYFKGKYNLRGIIRDLISGDCAASSLVALSSLDKLPESAGFYHMVSNLKRLNGCLDAAISSARVAIEKRPDNAFFHYNLYKLLVLNGQEDAAIDACYAANSYAESDNLGYKHALVQMLIRRHRFDEAEAVFLDCLQVDQKNAWTHHYIGLMETERNRPDKAVIAQARACRLSKNEQVFTRALDEALDRLGPPILGANLRMRAREPQA